MQLYIIIYSSSPSLKCRRSTFCFFYSLYCNSRLKSQSINGHLRLLIEWFSRVVLYSKRLVIDQTWHICRPGRPTYFGWNLAPKEKLSICYLASEQVSSAAPICKAMWETKSRDMIDNLGEENPPMNALKGNPNHAHRTNQVNWHFADA